MLTEEFLAQVMRLGEREKLKLVELLIEDLKLIGTAYEIYTPFGNEAAARVLFGELESAQTANQPETE